MPRIEHEGGGDATIEAVLDRHKKLVELVLVVLSKEELQSFIEDIGATYYAEAIRETIRNDDDDE